MQLGQLGRGRGERQPQLLQPARHAHRPALVAEVPLDLTDDRRGRVGGELHATVRVEAVDGLDQPDGGDLREVVQRLAAVAEPACQVLDERQVHAHQPVAQLRVLRTAVLQRAQFEEEGARPAAVVRVVMRVRARRTRCAPRAGGGRRRPVLGLSLVLAHRPARRPSPSARLVPRHRLGPGGGVPTGCGRSGRGSAPRGAAALPAARRDTLRGVVLRMRPGLLGDAVDAVRHALGRQLPCAAFFVPHRPVLAPHAGPGPAPRCL